MGPHDNAAKLFNEQDRSRDELLIDLVETTGGALLGMTLSCCRCHDHKFDPLSQADYFRFRACFAGVKFADELPIDLVDIQAQINQHNAQIDKQIAQSDSERKQLLNTIRQRVADGHASDAKKKEIKPKELKELATESEKQQLEALDSTIKQFQSEKRKLTHAMLMLDEAEPPATYILAQGDYKSPKTQVEPGIFSILNPNTLPAEKALRANSPGRRWPWPVGSLTRTIP